MRFQTPRPPNPPHAAGPTLATLIGIHLGFELTKRFLQRESGAVSLGAQHSADE